jgi:hypothetical protein
VRRENPGATADSITPRKKRITMSPAQFFVAP